MISQRACKRGSPLGRIILVCATTLVSVAASCPTEKAAVPRERTDPTRTLINNIREAIFRFERTNGRLPEDLAEVCPEDNSCPMDQLDMEREGVRDRWGQRLIYRKKGADYELRSAGPDGQADTDDDIVYDRAAERELMRKVAGCYEVDFSRWSRYPGGPLVLDTASVAPGVYRLRPMLGRYDHPVWVPVSQDSIQLTWFEVHSITRINFRLAGDYLFGRTRIPKYGERDIVARRIGCVPSVDGL